MRSLWITKAGSVVNPALPNHDLGSTNLFKRCGATSSVQVEETPKQKAPSWTRPSFCEDVEGRRSCRGHTHSHSHSHEEKSKNRRCCASETRGHRVKADARDIAPKGKSAQFPSAVTVTYVWPG